MTVEVTYKYIAYTSPNMRVWLIGCHYGSMKTLKRVILYMYAKFLPHCRYLQQIIACKIAYSFIKKQWLQKANICLCGRMKKITHVKSTGVPSTGNAQAWKFCEEKLQAWSIIKRKNGFLTEYRIQKKPGVGIHCPRTNIFHYSAIGRDFTTKYT